MTAPHLSPPARRLAAPRWLDARLVVGILLVLVSVVVGARVLSSADRSETMWMLTRPLAAGTPLAAGDLEAGRVRLFGHAGSYVQAVGAKPVGYVLRRPLGARELLPRDALGSPGEVDVRQVTVPVVRGHAPPDLAAGQVVDLYVTPGSTASRTATGPPRLVRAGLTVLQRSQESKLGGNDQDGIVLRATPDEVGPLLAALAEGRIDLVRVPRSSLPTLTATPPPTPSPVATPTVTPSPTSPVTPSPVVTSP